MIDLLAMQSGLNDCIYVIFLFNRANSIDTYRLHQRKRDDVVDAHYVHTHTLTYRILRCKPHNGAEIRIFCENEYTL